MGRVKTKIELITSKKKCDSTFQLRSKGMKKKAYELSTLCGIKVGMIFINSSRNLNAEIWPKNQEDGTKTLTDLIAAYRNQELVQRKKRSFNSSHFLEAKENQVLAQQTVSQYSIWDSNINDMSGQELQDLSTLVEMKIKKVENKIQYLRGDDDHQSEVVISPDQPHDVPNSPTMYPQQFPSTEEEVFDFELDPNDIIGWESSTISSHDYCSPTQIDDGIPPVNYPIDMTSTHMTTSEYYPMNMLQIMIQESDLEDFEGFNCYAINYPEPWYVDDVSAT